MKTAFFRVSAGVVLLGMLACAPDARKHSAAKHDNSQNEKERESESSRKQAARYPLLVLTGLGAIADWYASHSE